MPLDNKDALAADGLYYAAWSCGNAKPYENKDGDTVDLYDAQLYLLLGEAKSTENAQHDKNTWLAAAEENYDVQQKEEISCNGFFSVSHASRNRKPINRHPALQ